MRLTCTHLHARFTSLSIIESSELLRKCCDVVVKDEKPWLDFLHCVRSDTVTFTPNKKFAQWFRQTELFFFFSLLFHPQGVTLTDVKEAEKNLGKVSDQAPSRTIQPVSPIVTVTPAERGE